MLYTYKLHRKENVDRDELRFIESVRTGEESEEDGEESEEDGEEEEGVCLNEVEAILLELDGKYLVKWRGFAITDCTLEPLENLINCARVLKCFNREKKFITFKMTKGLVDRRVKEKRAIFELEQVVKVLRFGRTVSVKWKGVPFTTIETYKYMKSNHGDELEEYEKSRESTITGVKRYRLYAEEVDRDWVPPATNRFSLELVPYKKVRKLRGEERLTEKKKKKKEKREARREKRKRKLEKKRKKRNVKGE